MTVAPHIVALALAAVQPADAGTQPAAAQPATGQAAIPPPIVPAADPNALLFLFDRVCVRREEAPAGFTAAQWSDFPEALRLMNTYGHGGTFLRSEIPSLTYIARTQGGAHFGPGIETRCGIAGRAFDSDVSIIVSRLAERASVRPAPPVETNGLSMYMLIGDRDAITVYHTEDGWVILRNMGILIPADMVRRRDLRRRRNRN